MSSIFEQEETCQKSINYFTQKEGIKETALKRLYNKDSSPVLGESASGHGLFVERSCDVLIPPLLRDKAPQNIREGILEALCETYNNTKRWLNNPETTSLYPLDNFLRVAEITKSKELEDKVDNLFYEAVEHIDEIVRDKDREEIFYSIFSAKRAYNNFSEEKDSQIIEMLLQRKQFAAAAYRAALSAGFNKTAEYLFELWCKYYDENWPVDVLFLSIITDNMNSSTFVKRVIPRLQKERKDIWQRIEKDMDKAVQEGSRTLQKMNC